MSHPDFSPDGRFVAYQRFIDGLRHVWVAAVSGTQPPTQLTFGTADDIQPSWSPAGDRVAFVSQRAGTSDTWVVPVRDGAPAGSPVRVASGGGSHQSPTWSPRGDRIAYVSEERDSSDIWVVPADGSRPSRRITRGTRAWFVRWHPGGRDLLASGIFGGSHAEIRLADPATGEVRPLAPPLVLTQQGSVPVFDVRPDGRVVVYSRATQTGNLFVADVRQ